MAARPAWKAVDHLVYATPNLSQTVDDLTQRFGVQPTPGGRHPGRGTANVLLRVGDRGCRSE